MFKNTKKYKVEIIIGLMIIAVISASADVTITENSGVLTIDGDLDVTGTFLGIGGGSENVAPSLSRIRNDNNNSWAVTESNLASAISDAGSWGTVWVGGDITLTSPIVIDETITLDFQGHSLTVPKDVLAFDITNFMYGTIRNVRIIINNGLTYPADKGNDHHDSIIKITSNEWGTRTDFANFEDIIFYNGGEYDSNYFGTVNEYNFHNFTCFELEVGNASTRIDSCVFRDIQATGCGEFMVLHTEDTAYINGNLFDNIYLNSYKKGIVFLHNSSNGANHNVFKHFKAQTSPASEYFVKDIAGTSNRFENMLTWDWDTATVNPDGQTVYSISADAILTYISDHGKLMFDYSTDSGLGSILTFANREIYYNADYDYYLWKAGSTYYCRLGEYGNIPVAGSYDANTDFEALMTNILAHDDILVVLDEGIYEVDDEIAVAGKNITIKGAGRHLTEIRGENGSTLTSGIFLINGYDNFTITDIVFSGEDTADTSKGLWFSSNEDSYGCEVRDCIFTNFKAGNSAALFVRPSSSDEANRIRITNCDFHNCDTAIYFNGDADSNITGSIIKNNFFLKCDTGVNLDYTDNSIVTHNIFDTCGTETTETNCYGNIVENNIHIG